ncbi:MAG: PEGA domain-containing protein [Pseudomonadales bacterium]
MPRSVAGVAHGTHVEAQSYTPPGETQAESKSKTKKPWLVWLFLLPVILPVIWFISASRSLTVNVMPDTANLDLIDGFAVKWQQHYLILPGSYELRGEAPGYESIIRPLIITEQDFQQLDLTLDKLPGRLDLSSQPAGATVYLNDKVVGESPLNLDKLVEGNYQLRLELDRYQSFEQGLVVRGMGQLETVDVELAPAWGEVTVSTVPAGASILVGNTEVALTPATVQVLAPGQDVAVQLAGYQSWQQAVTIEAGDSSIIPTIHLQQADAQMVLISSPPRVAVTVDGVYQGVTPVTVAVRQGSHQLSYFAEGYQPKDQTVSIRSGENRELIIKLEPSPADIRIEAVPAEAVLYIDGKKAKGGPVYSLSARPHKVEARLAGYQSQSKTVTPKPGLAQSVVLKLKPVAAKVAAAKTDSKVITTSSGQKLQRMSVPVTFVMGATRREPGRRANEAQRAVTLIRPFYIAETEVTNAQFKRYRAGHVSGRVAKHSLDQNNQPAVKVSWQEAAAYCNWLSKQDGLKPFYKQSQSKVSGINPAANGYRLPTEAEWAYAARVEKGGKLLKHGWGAVFPPTVISVNLADQSARNDLSVLVPGYTDGYPVTAPVASFAVNSKGLYDMDGNASEWVHDYYSVQISSLSQAKADPLGPEAGSRHVIRGASWRSGSITETRLSWRDQGDDGRRDVGFRIARYAK